jgi:SMI1/KNR4 family protein SUKH-1
MRKLDKINDYADIYQPVPESDIETAESRLGFTFPRAYRQFVLQPDIEIIKKLPSPLWFVRHRSLGILDVNTSLRRRAFRPYPEHLIAFATNECGDYFCFDRETGRIIYIDPDTSIEDNLERNELVFDSFESWVERSLARRRGRLGGEG